MHGCMATCAINMSDAASAVAGVKFARRHNLRLVVKNTGHDLGRASGPALRLGTGVQVRELSEFAGGEWTTSCGWE
jgi:hypothetical protein